VAHPGGRFQPQLRPGHASRQGRPHPHGIMSSKPDRSAAITVGALRRLLEQPRDRSWTQAQLIGHPPDRSTAPPQCREIRHLPGIMLGTRATSNPPLGFGTLQPGDRSLAQVDGSWRVSWWTKAGAEPSLATGSPTRGTSRGLPKYSFAGGVEGLVAQFHALSCSGTSDGIQLVTSRCKTNSQSRRKRQGRRMRS
jgi:hypothetical protein